MLGICVGVYCVYVLGNNVTYMLDICVGVHCTYLLGNNDVYICWVYVLGCGCITYGDNINYLYTWKYGENQ